MNNFQFHNTTKIIFGKGTELQLAEEIKPFTNKILLHYGGGSIKKIGLYDSIRTSLTEAGIEIVELPGAMPNPRLGLVREGIAICKKENIEFILAVGGGSVIDSAKAIAAGAYYDGDVWELFSGLEIKKALPLGCVLTIPAAGSESSPHSVVTNEDGWYKRAIHSSLLAPKFAIMNPELTFSLPDFQTACGVSDIMAHLMERYFTKVQKVDLTDRLIEATLKSVIRNALIVKDNPNDYDARAEIMWAGTIAHNDLLETGRVGDWGSHDVEHELSAIYDVAHGAGLSVIFPAWMKYAYSEHISKFVQFFNRVFAVEIDIDSDERTVLEGIKRLENFFREMGLPVTLKELGVADDRKGEMANKAAEEAPLGNLKKLYRDDIYAIYQLADI